MTCEGNYKDNIVNYEWNYRDKTSIKMFRPKHYIFFICSYR